MAQDPKVIWQGNPISNRHQPDPSQTVDWANDKDSRLAAIDALNIDARLGNLESTVTAGQIQKAPVALAVTETNITLSGELTIDGTLTSSSRVAVAGQTNMIENGIYITSSGAWSRAADMNASDEVHLTTVLVQGGGSHGGETWKFQVSDPDTFVLGVNAIGAVKVADAEALKDYLDAGIEGKLDTANTLSELSSEAGAARYNIGAASASDLAKKADASKVPQTDSAGKIASSLLPRSAYLPGAEALYPASYAIPKGWYDTGERLLSGASARALMCNWSPAALDLDVVSFEFGLGGLSMWQDMAGTVPVSEEGDPVALVEAPAYGYVAIEIVNPWFNTDLTGWTVANGTASVVSGKARVVRSGGTASIVQAVKVEAGKVYKFRVTAEYVSGPTSAAALVVREGPGSTDPSIVQVVGSNGAYANLEIEGYKPSTSGTVYLHLTVSGAAGTYDFDDVVMAERKFGLQALPVINPGFDDDLSGWGPTNATAAQFLGKAHVTRSTTTASIAQAFRVEAGKVYNFRAKAAFVEGASAAGALVLRSGPDYFATSIMTTTGAVGADADLELVGYTPAQDATVYLHLTVASAAGTYAFDDVEAEVDLKQKMYVGNNAWRPTWHTDGVRSWLEFDGVSSRMLVDISGVALPGFAGGVWASYRPLAKVDGWLWTADGNVISGAGLVIDTSGDYFRLGGTQNNMDFSTDDRVAAMIWDRNAGTGLFGREGDLSPASVGTGGADYEISIGSRFGSAPAKFRLYGFTVVREAVPLDQCDPATRYHFSKFRYRPREINVFLVGGQSNADGRAATSGGPSWIQDLIVDGVKNWNGSELEDYYWTDNTGPNGTGESWVTSGAEGTFSFACVATKLLADEMENVVVCRVTEGGTRVDPSYNARGSWHADYDAIDAVNPATPHLLEALEDKFAALSAYCNAQGIKLNVRGLFWHQGESNANIANAEFQDNTEAVFAKVRAFTGIADLPIVSGTISHSSSGYNADIETQMLAIASGDANTWYVDNTSLTLFDGLHFDAASTETFGTAAAAQMLAAIS